MKRVILKLFIFSTTFLFLSNLLFAKRYSPSIYYMKRGKFNKVFKSSSVTIYSTNKLETEHFIIYYGDSDPATTFWADYNKNNIPDYIDNVATIIEFVFNYEINILGYNSPLLKEKCNVVIANTGAKINSEEVTIDKKICGYSYEKNGKNILVLNPVPPSTVFTNSKNMLKVTITHEFFHIVQFGYSENFANTNIWLYEGTAVWMENQVYPDIDDYIYSYANDLIQNTEEGLASSKGFHPYGASLFFDYLSFKFGTKIIKDIWENFKEKESAIEAIKDVVEKQYSTDFASLLYDFYKAILSPEGNFSDGDKLSEESFQIEAKLMDCNSSVNETIGMFGAVYFKTDCKYTGFLSYESVGFIIDNLTVYSDSFNFAFALNETELVIPYSSNAVKSPENIFYNVTIKNIDSVSLSLNYKWTLTGTPYEVNNMEIFNLPSIYTVWMWDNQTWRIFIPDDKTELNSVAEKYSLKKITHINAGSGVWINAKNSGEIVFNTIKTGNCGIETDFSGSWNLESTACINSFVPNKLSNVKSVKTIWKWTGTKWQVWSPEESIRDLIESYQIEEIDSLEINDGFWVNK